MPPFSRRDFLISSAGLSAAGLSAAALAMADLKIAAAQQANAGQPAADAPAPSLTTMSTKLYSQVMAGRICSTHTSLMSAEGAPSGANDAADGAAV